MPRWTRALGLATLMLLLGPGAALAKSLCATIPQGTLKTSAGDTIQPGFDAWGYNGDFAHPWGQTHGAARRPSPTNPSFSALPGMAALLLYRRRVGASQIDKAGRTS